MYHHFFGLSESAFSIAVNPRYLYMSRQHREAMAHLLYGIQGGGFVLLSGEVGTGKTTIIRSLLEQLPENTDVALVFNPMASAPEILAMINDELGVAYDPQNPNLKARTDALYHFLLQNHARGHNTVLLIDEAQLLAPEALEQIRLLTNLETHTQKLLQIILVGQPELNALLAQPRLRQLSQRITARFHLRPLNLNETRAYIQHRLQVAGLEPGRSPFSARLVRKIYRASGGIPRRVNMLCERLLVGLYAHNRRHANGRLFSQAKKEVFGDLPQRHSGRWPWLVALCATIVLGLLGAAYIGWTPERVITQNLVTDAAAPSTGAAPLLDTLPSADAIPSTDILPDTPKLPDIVEPEPEKAAFFTTLIAAQQHLFTYLEISASASESPCWGASRPLQCETLRLDNWPEALAINRPLILTLTTPEKFVRYVVMVAVEEQQQAQLLTASGNTYPMPLAELGLQWNGQVFYAWRSPSGYSAPLKQGDRAPVVRWLAEQFAALDKQPAPLTQEVYNRALAERVRLFQQSVGLQDDGVAGQQTLFKLNEVLGLDKTLDKVVLPAVPGD